MFNEISLAVKDSVIMVSSFCIFMLFCLASNTTLGAVTASQNKNFQIGKLISGIVKNLVIVFGIDLLAVGVSGLSKLIEIYEIMPEYSDSVSEITTLAIVAIIITLSYRVYGKQAIEKIKAIGELKEEDIIPVTMQDGWMKRGT